MSRGKFLVNDNYCVTQRGFVEMAGKTETFVDSYQTLNVNCFAVTHVPFVAWQPQKKGTTPNVKELKYVKSASCLGQFCYVQLVTSVHTVGQNLLIKARLN